MPYPMCKHAHVSVPRNARMLNNQLHLLLPFLLFILSNICMLVGIGDRSVFRHRNCLQAGHVDYTGVVGLHFCQQLTL